MNQKQKCVLISVGLVFIALVGEEMAARRQLRQKVLEGQRQAVEDQRRSAEFISGLWQYVQFAGQQRQLETRRYQEQQQQAQEQRIRDMQERSLYQEGQHRYREQQIMNLQEKALRNHLNKQGMY